MIGYVHEQANMDVFQLSKMFGLCQNTIKTAISYCENPWPLPLIGRPKTLQPHHLLYIEARTLSNRTMTNKELAQELCAFYPDLAQSKLHPTTVGRARNKMGLHFLPMRRNCAITPQSRATRVRWCQEQQEIQRDWTRVVFSDESWFELSGTRRKWLWRHHNDYGEDVTMDRVAHPKKVMIWGAIGHNFKSKLVFIDGNITGDVYFDDIICGSHVLDDADQVYGFNQWLFQHDNARPHFRKDILEAMSNLDIHILPRWPPYSPDLNIIETVWAIMKRRVEKENPKTISDLKKVISDVWKNLSFQTINALVAEMPNRLLQVIAGNGMTLQHL